MEGGGGQLCSWAQYRLPSTVVPLYYNLTLNVTMTDPYPVVGEVAIAVNVTQVSSGQTPAVFAVAADGWFLGLACKLVSKVFP